MPRNRVTTERQAKDQRDQAVEMLAEVRRYVWEELQKMPKDSDCLPSTTDWLENLSKAIHLLDPGADDLLMPAGDAALASLREVLLTGKVVPLKPIK
jgi:hypothetical protein